MESGWDKVYLHVSSSGTQPSAQSLVLPLHTPIPKALLCESPEAWGLFLPLLDPQRCSRPMFTIHVFNRDLSCAGKGRGQVERKRYIIISTGGAYSWTRGTKYTSLKS